MSDNGRGTYLFRPRYRAMIQSLISRVRANYSMLPPSVQRYGFALLCIVAAVGVRVAVIPVMGKHSFFIFVMAILASAWRGGIGPAILSLVALHVIHGYYFEEPRGLIQPTTASIVTTIGYYVIGITAGALSQLRASALRRAQAEHRQASAQREQLLATLSCMADGVLVTDCHGWITLMNPAAESMSGWSLKEACGKPWWEVFAIQSEEGQPEPESPIDRVLSQGHIVQERMPLVLASSTGQRRPVAYTAAPVRDDEGHTTGVVLVLRDESERRRAELALTNADRRKDEFLATLAHELRNPLAPISTGLDLLSMSPEDAQGSAEIRAMMKRQTQHMVRLIDDLLDLSRITCGKLDLRKSQLEFRDVIRDAVEATRAQYAEAKHQLTIKLPDYRILLYADASRLTQVLVNLLNNACKYTPREGLVELSAELSGGEAVVTIADSGIGIPHDKLDSVFEMFTQVNERRGFGQTGLGIGLALVKRIVEMHGGAVEVQSRGRNLGTTFSIRLPAVPSPPADVRHLSFDANVATTRIKRRILVVDDNADALESLSRLVAMLGNEVRIARDGLEAIEVGREFKPEVVLMDIGMPNLNGYDAARQMRQERWGQQASLIATTGWGQDEDRRSSDDAGFNQHLVKPITLAALTAVFGSDGVSAAQT